MLGHSWLLLPSPRMCTRKEHRSMHGRCMHIFNVTRRTIYYSYILCSVLPISQVSALPVVWWWWRHLSCDLWIANGGEACVRPSNFGWQDTYQEPRSVISIGMLREDDTFMFITMSAVYSVGWLRTLCTRCPDWVLLSAFHRLLVYRRVGTTRSGRNLCITVTVSDNAYGWLRVGPRCPKVNRVRSWNSSGTVSVYYASILFRHSYNSSTAFL